MCKLIHFKLCVEVEQDHIAPPEDDLVRCLEWPQLLSSARQGNSVDRQRLQSHIEGKSFARMSFAEVDKLRGLMVM